MLIKFTVAKSGKVKGARAINQELPILEQEALRVVGAMPRWGPAHYEGRPVPYSLIVPITFSLD